MTSKRILRLAAAPALALAALTGCTTGFDANVARFQQLPPAQGQSFTVVAEDSRDAGGLEFQHYADLVAERLASYGYSRAADPAEAQLVVRLGYDVGPGTEKVVSSGFARDPFYYDPFWSPYGYRGWRGRYVYGFYDPFLWGPAGGYADVSSYTVYDSRLTLRIDRAGSGQSVFDGTARARSLSNKQTYIVPNLIDAMFTGFPGNSGEEIKVTVAPEPKK